MENHIFGSELDWFCCFSFYLSLQRSYKFQPNGVEFMPPHPSAHLNFFLGSPSSLFFFFFITKPIKTSKSFMPDAWNSFWHFIENDNCIVPFRRLSRIEILQVYFLFYFMIIVDKFEQTARETLLVTYSSKADANLRDHNISRMIRMTDAFYPVPLLAKRFFLHSSKFIIGTKNRRVINDS